MQAWSGTNSCQEPLKEGQFRLAIGFKFMRQAPVRQYLVTWLAGFVRGSKHAIQFNMRVIWILRCLPLCRDV